MAAKAARHGCTAETLPVTALSFAECNGRELLFAGEGCKLKVFEPQTKACSRAWQVLPHSCIIHGIRHRSCTLVDGTDHACCVLVFGQTKLRIVKYMVDGTDHACCVLVFGQTKLRIVKYSVSPDALEQQVVMLSDVQEPGDWILEAQWLDGEENTVAMVMAHNHVTLWNWQKGHTKAVVQSEVNCILYSARLLGNRPDDLIVASGTVFNAVLLWKVKGAVDEHTKRVRVNLSLRGHAGVIFGVRFSQDVRRVCSVSDDRTIRVWTLPEDWLASYDQRLEQADLVLYGHTARVWDGFLLGDCVISAGEDVTCRVWSYQGECVDIIEGHKGRNIWSVAVNYNQTLVATGGDDCSIRLTPIQRKRRNGGTLFQLTVRGGPPDSEDSSCSDFVRSVRMCSDSTVLCLSNKGQLCSLSVDATSGTYQWEVLCSDIHFSTYSVMDISPCRHFVAIGNLTGQVKLSKLYHSNSGLSLDPEATQVFTAHHGKVFSLHFTSASDRIVLITNGPDGILMLWEVGPESDEGVLPPVLPLACCVLPPCKHRWLTAALLSPLPSHPAHLVLVCGDRSGSLHSYSLTEMGGAGVDGPTTPTTTLRGVHGRHGVSSLSHHMGHLLTTGREGHYRQLALGQDGRLHELAKHKIFKGFDWLERLVFLRNELLVVGFHSADLVVHNVTVGRTLLRVTCGGAHRSWDFAVSCKVVDQQGFVYLKGSEIHFHLLNMQLESHQAVLQAAYHGREANCVTVLKDRSKGSVYLATGSEDCTIQISEYNGVSTPLTTVGTADGHISSVRALSTTVSQLTGKTLLFSGGGRASMKAWEIQEGGSHSNHSPTLVLQSEMTLHLLSERQRRKLQRHAHPSTPPPPDCRIMSLTSFPISVIEGLSSSSNLHCVVAACSDSRLRVYVYDEVRSRFHLAREMDHHPWCLFAIHHTVVYPPSSSHLQGPAAKAAAVFVFVGTAEGTVSVWDLTAQLREWVAEKTSHWGCVGCERKPTATTGQASLAEAASLEEALKPSQRQSTPPAPANVLTEPLTHHPSVSPRTVGLPSVPLDDGGSEALVNQLAQRLQSSLVTSERVGVKTITEGTGEGATMLPVFLDTCTAANYDSAAEPTKNTLGKEGGVCGVKPRPSLVLSGHQSGVNAVDVCRVDGNGCLYMVLSGGDDTAITASLCRLHPQVGIVTRKTHPSAHFSAVTGVKLLNSITPVTPVTAVTAVTVSVDQRLSLWKLSLLPSTGETFDLQITHTRSMMTDVCDISAIAVIPKRLGEEESKEAIVAVAGVGVQCVNMKIS